MKKMMLIAPVCFSFAARSDGSVDESSVAAMIKAMEDRMQEQMKEQMAALHGEMAKKDETIATLSAALKVKMHHKQVKLTACVAD